MFTHLTHLKRDDFIHPDHVVFELLERVDAFMTYMVAHVDSRARFKVLSGYRPGDSGWHGQGLAVDGTVIGRDGILPLRVQWLCAERFNFSGLGIYPYNWFLHLDIRPLKYENLTPESRWWRWPVCPDCEHPNGRNDTVCAACGVSLYRDILDPYLWEILGR
jgi:hypothetical protein